MSEAGSPTLHGQVVADVMLAEPKTLPPYASVEAARRMLEDPKVQMLLLADGTEFRGAITAIPPGADPGARADAFVDDETETIGPDEPAEVAFARTRGNPQRRIVVLDEERNLLGLLCLDKTLTHFCRAHSS